MGRVDLVIRHEGNFRRLYAIKRLHAQYREDEEFRSMFLDEARIAGLVRHPNVVSVLDVGEDPRGPYLVMDFIEGVSVAELVRRLRSHKAPMPLAIALQIAIQTAEGLHSAHELVGEDGRLLQLVHRDVSPQNILIGFDGIARVTDFGIAKAVGGSSSRTQTGMLKGKIGYVSPEQLRFEALDRRSDIFSFGIVLFEMIAGRRLYARSDNGPSRILREAPPDLGLERDGLPSELVELTFELLAKDPAIRPATCRDVATRLRTILEELLLDDANAVSLADFLGLQFKEREVELREEIQEAMAQLSEGKLRPWSETTAATPPTPPRRRPILQWSLFGLVALALGFGGFWLGQDRQDSNARPPTELGLHRAPLRGPTGRTCGRPIRGPPIPLVSGAFPEPGGPPPMRVLVAGSGGREHALVWKIASSPRAERVFAAPGNAGMRDATCFPDVSAADSDALIAVARQHEVDLVVVGPEDPLVDGVADRLRDAGFAVFGPGAAAAQLEGSKHFARAFMARHGIPQPTYARFDDLGAAVAHAREQGGPCVVKADGLAAGKGVTVCDGPDDAVAALTEIMQDRRFGASGDEVLIEERLVGEEASYYAISDGTNVVTLAPAQDHKRALDGDRGENTGGMGAYAPAPVVDAAVEKRVLEEIVHPTIRGMREEGNPFTGVLYVGLMIADGEPKVIEFNVRFGDPEIQALVMQMRGDLLPLLDGAARGALDTGDAPAAEDAAVCVILASGGYPRSYETGKVISGIAEAEAEADGDVVVFHSGTKADGDRVVTNGGRVLGVTARGSDVADARARAYAAADRIAFDGRQLRRDIADRALDR